MNVKIVTMNGVKVMDNKSNDVDWIYQNAFEKNGLKIIHRLSILGGQVYDMPSDLRFC